MATTMSEEGYNVHEAEVKLNKLNQLLKMNGDFVKLLRELLVKHPDQNESYKTNEAWRLTQLRLVENLSSAIAKKKNTNPTTGSGSSSRTGFSTFFEKQKPPKFSGDCLDYNEWQIKWGEVVHCHNIPEQQELGILKESIPEMAQKKLYKVIDLKTAWEKLKNLSGDDSLIIQKLKSRLRDLKIIKKEPHEVIIEIKDEVEYLVKRLTELKSVDLLHRERDYLTCLYMLLPQVYKDKWDYMDKEGFSNHWEAFISMMDSCYAKALDKRVMQESIKSITGDTSKEKEKVTCKNCGKPNHTAATCRSAIKTHHTELHIRDQAGFDRAKARYGKCLVCKGEHVFKKDGFQIVGLQ